MKSFRLFPVGVEKLGYVYLMQFLLYYAFLVLATPFQALVGAIILTLFAGVYVLSFRGGIRVKLACLITEAILMYLMAAVVSIGYFWLAFYPVSLLGINFKLKHVHWGLVLLAAGSVADLFAISLWEHALFLSILRSWPMVLGGGLVVMVAAYVTYWQARNIKSQKELEEARSEIERLGKTAERERISQDLHDVMGHQLSMITLKAQLVARLLDKDPKRAKAEVEDIEQAARQALKQVRDYISNIRQPHFEEEWQAAVNLLQAAGITCHAECAASLTDTCVPVRQVLAMCLREAVTNIVRHSQASKALLRVTGDTTHVQLLVVDNGIGLLHPGMKHAGNGLNGIRARLATVDGTLQIFSPGQVLPDGQLPVVPWRKGTVLQLTARRYDIHESVREVEA